MGKLILVTGGARSGKSSFAEELAGKFGDSVLYIATSIPFDDEMKLRIKKHKEQRPAHWETLEAFRDIGEAMKGKISGKSAVMLDCITVMVTNLMFETSHDWDNIAAEDMEQVESRVMSEIQKLIGAAKGFGIPFIAVTNETGMGIVPCGKLSRLFTDIAGRVNQMLARSADEVYLCVSGIPVRIK
ncbi:MAG: bifunctional adenosylcobinamide kinase/adenosylcobinamide-phosphate guanylyltransferase [Clostridia bacterium]|nr:bifunctional adenosylcobinamide kinase/adenosylcobinamide-phosphate guanylyltransferase [Clostridia bacterium]